MRNLRCEENGLRNSGERAGDLVAILGVGGLGHLGVQFAARMGFNTVAIAREKDKEPLPASWAHATTLTAKPKILGKGLTG